MDGRVAVLDGEPVEVDDVVCSDGEIGPGVVHRVRKVGFFRGGYEVVVLWSTGSYSSNVSGLGAVIHGQRAADVFTDEPDMVEVVVARNGELLPLGSGGLTLRFVPTGQVLRILEYVAGLPADAAAWGWDADA